MLCRSFHYWLPRSASSCLVAPYRVSYLIFWSNSSLCFCSFLHQTHFTYSNIHSKTSSETNILPAITIRSLSISILRCSLSPKKSEMEMEMALRFADLGPKGTGLFATRNLPRGTRIIAETPDFTFPKTMTRRAI
jgi:hypothetical protein